MKNKKILIILSDYLFVRNYIETKVFNKIINTKHYTIEFLINKSLKLNKKKLKNIKTSYFEYSNNERQKFLKIFQRKIWIDRSKSNSFKFKLKIYLNFNKYINSDDEHLLQKIIKFPLRLLRFIKNYISFFYDTLIIFSPIHKLYEDKIEINKLLKSKIFTYKPDLIIMPTNTINPTKYDLYKILKKVKIKVLYLVDNWDNLSSKSTFFNKNSLFTVWGKQTLQHAVKIQKIKKKNVYLMGTPRYEKYFRLRNKNITSNFKFKYILFLESTLPTESNILPLVDNIISGNNYLRNLKLIYRPHPWRKSVKIFKQKYFKNIIIDPQVKENYLKKNFQSYIQPNLNYYPSLLKNAEFIISGPTSMIIEALILRKPVLLLNFKNENTLLNPYNIFKNFTHFKNISKSPAIIQNNEIQNLEKDMIKCSKLVNKNLYLKIDRHRDFFLTENCKNYKSNLNKIIKKILI